MVGTLPRAVFDKAFSPLGGDHSASACFDGLRVLLNLTLPFSGDDKEASMKALPLFAESEARRWRSWFDVVVVVDGADTPGKLFLFADRWLVFLDDDPAEYIIVLGYNVAVGELGLRHRPLDEVASIAPREYGSGLREMFASTNLRLADENHWHAIVGTVR